MHPPPAGCTPWVSKGLLKGGSPNGVTASPKICQILGIFDWVYGRFGGRSGAGSQVDCRGFAVAP